MLRRRTKPFQTASKRSEIHDILLALRGHLRHDHAAHQKFQSN